MRGEIRRGYFVEGLSGMQFALPSAAEELRRLCSEQYQSEKPVIVNACDPANPFGGGVAIQRVGPQPSRIPSNYIVFQHGSPVLIMEGNGARLHTIGEPAAAVIHRSLEQFMSMIKMPEQFRPFKEISVEHCNGERATQSSLAAILTALGFRRDANQTMRYDGYV